MCHLMVFSKPIVVFGPLEVVDNTYAFSGDLEEHVVRTLNVRVLHLKVKWILFSAASATHDVLVLEEFVEDITCFFVGDLIAHVDACLFLAYDVIFPFKPISSSHHLHHLHHL